MSEDVGYNGNLIFHVSSKNGVIWYYIQRFILALKIILVWAEIKLKFINLKEYLWDL